MGLRPTVIVHGNYADKTYFFSKDHCQRTDEGFVPVTFYLPYPTPRNGFLKSKEEIAEFHYSAMKEVPNPDPAFQA